MRAATITSITSFLPAAKQRIKRLDECLREVAAKETQALLAGARVAGRGRL